jgi:hypothetical protein
MESSNVSIVCATERSNVSIVCAMERSNVSIVCAMESKLDIKCSNEYITVQTTFYGTMSLNAFYLS